MVVSLPSETNRYRGMTHITLNTDYVPGVSTQHAGKTVIIFVQGTVFRKAILHGEKSFYGVG